MQHLRHFSARTHLFHLTSHRKGGGVNLMRIKATTRSEKGGSTNETGIKAH